MKSKRWFAPLGALAFLLLCLAPRSEAQSCAYLSGGAPWQLGLACTLNSSSTPFDFDARGLSYFQLKWVPNGTISAASVSLDSASSNGGSYATGGIIPSATIGSIASAGTYSNSSPTTPAYSGQLTPTVTGTGSITLVLYGYVNPPSSAGGGASGNVQVTNTPNVSVTNTPNVAVSNTSTTSGPVAITSSNAASVSLGGAGCVVAEITTVTGTFSAGNLLFKWAPDNTTFYTVGLFPTSGGLVSGANISTIPYTGWAAGDVWLNNLPSGGTFEVVGDGTLAGGTSVTVVVNASQASCAPPGTTYDSNGLPEVDVKSLAAIPSSQSGYAFDSMKFINGTGAITAIKASGGNFYGFSLTNGTAAVCFVEFFNTASGSVSLGTTAVVAAYELPASSTVTLPPGITALRNYSTAVTYAAVTAENGSTTCATTGEIYVE